MKKVFIFFLMLGLFCGSANYSCAMDGPEDLGFLPIPGLFGDGQETEDLINATELDGDNAWLFLKDEILWVPECLAAIISIPAGIGGVVGGWKFVNWLDKKEKKSDDGFFKEKFGNVFSWLLVKPLFIFASTVGVFKGVKCSVNTLCYGYFVNRFLKKYKVNRNKIPKKMIGFFDHEYVEYKKVGCIKYLRNVKKVVDVVRAAVAWHEDKQKFPEALEIEELQFEPDPEPDVSEGPEVSEPDVSEPDESEPEVEEVLPEGPEAAEQEEVVEQEEIVDSEEPVVLEEPVELGDVVKKETKKDVEKVEPKEIPRRSPEFEDLSDEEEQES